MDLMFRDESSHVIKKANAKARKRSGTTTSAKTTPSPSKPVPQPATLSSSPSASFSTSKPSRKKGRARRYSSSSSSAESGSDSPPSAFTSTFQLDPAPKAGQDASRYVKQEPETPSTAGLPAPAELPTPVSSGYSPTSTVDLPGPAPCRYSPSYEERGLNLFIARYISIVCAPSTPMIDGSLTFRHSRRTHAKTNLTCKPTHSRPTNVYCPLTSSQALTTVTASLTSGHHRPPPKSAPPTPSSRACRPWDSSASPK